MDSLQRYEALIEEFSYKCYKYAGDTIQLSIKDDIGSIPVFAMKDTDLMGKLSKDQKEELDTILHKAMAEVLRNKPEGQNVKEYLGWNWN